jgi:hypothetical protein
VNVARAHGRGTARGRIERVVLVPAVSLRGRLTAIAAHGRRSQVRAIRMPGDDAVPGASGLGREQASVVRADRRILSPSSMGGPAM